MDTTSNTKRAALAAYGVQPSKSLPEYASAKWAREQERRDAQAHVTQH